MTRPVAADGVSVSNGSWHIYDAGAFTVGKSQTVHAVGSFPHGVTVTAKCGVVGYTDYFGVYPANWTGQDYSNRPAVWAGSAITCKTCRQRSS